MSASLAMVSIAFMYRVTAMGLRGLLAIGLVRMAEQNQIKI
jgi:hypothetical protein